MPKCLRRFDDHVNDAAAGRFAPAERAADRHRLARDDLRHGMALVLGIGVHDPRHHLLVGSHIRRRHVDFRSDEIQRFPR